MISFTKIIHMVIALAFTFLSLAGLYVLLEAEFIAFVQVLIYAGAITILMIFGIMLTKHTSEQAPPPKPLHHALILGGIIVFFGILFFAIQDSFFPEEMLVQTEDNTKALGELIFTQYVIPFELVSVLLTVAFIGAIVLAKREEE